MLKLQGITREKYTTPKKVMKIKNKKVKWGFLCCFEKGTFLCFFVAIFRNAVSCFVTLTCFLLCFNIAPCLGHEKDSGVQIGFGFPCSPSSS